MRLGITVDELVGFENQCQEIVSKNDDLLPPWFSIRRARILFHSDPAQHLLVLTDHETMEALRDGREYVETSLKAGDRDYEIFVPVFDKIPTMSP